MEVFILVVSALFLLLGVLGSFLPVLPGAPLAFLGILLYHFFRGGFFSDSTLFIFGALTVISVALDYSLPFLGAKIYGVSRKGMIGLGIGMVLGLAVLSFPGMLLGMFLGAFLGEIIANKETDDAIKAGIAVFVGSFVSMIFKTSLSIAMLVYFLWKII